MRLGICSRTNDVVEPLSKPQWYVDCSKMAKKGLDAVMDEEKKKKGLDADMDEEKKKKGHDAVMDEEKKKKGLDAIMDEEKKKIEIIPKQYAADWKRWSFISFNHAL